MACYRLSVSSVWPFIILATLAVVRAQNTLQIQYPPPQPSPQIKDLYPKQYVKFTWTSTWPNTSLYIYQGPNSLGNTAHNKLEEGVGPGVSEHAWSAHKLTKNMDRNDAFWLYLYNTNNQSCQTCTSNSTRFYIRDQQTDTTLKIGLGVGLGVGIPLVVAISGLSVWLCMRRRRNGQRESHSMLLQDSPAKDDAKVTPASTALASATPTTGYVSSVEKDSPLESGGQDVVELPPNFVQGPVEAPATRERVELEGDFGNDREAKHAGPGWQP
ncbi:hypothetical protein M409DRAFT_23658 [Zasmidium cellare ATCC 36951]|uniref:Mid2 domain-containing protein n=1 Tax=Zasmidium cellare ATCC 36951 TaxID=1080233 RepID=A0A6A6CFB7_ZASCE|nr:uncharacterized protein M409DRAFT_23658 [Zasmidium cellare ATCC 36951]KAF2165927.1 hypothetical protein M409DRAFT_23658 [Zasmidium cellare ATCC 36951]